MCGIAGEYDRTGAGIAGPHLVRRMCATLVHRGPDSEGYYTFPEAEPRVSLGVRRLSIIDLETGDQPLFNEDRSLTLVFNGEIYNHVELRAELEQRGHRFGSGNDGETIVHLYEERDLELFSSLRGMYAFALWDAPRDRLVLAVDHVGIKPLYVAENSGRLLFASEAKALLVDEALPRRVNLAAVDTYLTFGYMVGPDTLFEGIRRLPPGHALVAERGATRLVRHFTLQYPPSSERRTDPGHIVEETRRRFGEAVRLHLRSDAPLGLFLSGGIDSTAILGSMHAAIGGGIKTFTVGYLSSDGHAPYADETVAARRVAMHFDTDHHELRLSAVDWWADLCEYVTANDEPIANPSMVALQALSRAAAAEVKVALNGTGGDELYAGYRAHRVHPRLLRAGAVLARCAPGVLRRRATGTLWQRVEAMFPALRRRRYVGALPPYLSELRTLLLPPVEAMRRLASFDGWTFSDTVRNELFTGDLLDACARTRHMENAFEEIFAANATADPADLVHALTIATWLPGNGLLALDKVTMAHGLEARVPFFDPPLLAHAAGIPPRIRTRGNKWVLREALRAELPAFAVAQAKRPFETPIRLWFDHELAGRIREVVLDPRSLGRGILRPAAVERLIARHFSGETDSTELVFRLLVLELWHQGVLEAPQPVSCGGDADGEVH